MPGQYWAYAFHVGLGSLLLIAIFALSAQQLAWLAALAKLPDASSKPVGSGAIYRGVLEGPVQSTPLGHAAVAWIGLVTKTAKFGKTRPKIEVCRFGALTDLHLLKAGAGLRRFSARGAQRLALASAIAAKMAATALVRLPNCLSKHFLSWPWPGKVVIFSEYTSRSVEVLTHARDAGSKLRWLERRLFTARESHGRTIGTGPGTGRWYAGATHRPGWAVRRFDSWRSTCRNLANASRAHPIQHSWKQASCQRDGATAARAEPCFQARSRGTATPGF